MLKNDILKDWENKKQKSLKSLAVLIDPDKAEESHLKSLCKKAKNSLIDYFFVGGSHLSTTQLDFVISYLKINCEIPVILFPGNTMQVNFKADAILLLSLIYSIFIQSLFNVYSISLFNLYSIFIQSLFSLYSVFIQSLLSTPA